MKIRLRFFGSTQDRVGVEEEDVLLDATELTIGGLRDFLMERGDQWREALAEPGLSASVNHRLAQASTPLFEGDEVGFFPPLPTE